MTPPATPPHRVGVVAIGRNEGQRLIRCLDSLTARAAAIVYVDSGSVDGSPEAARQRGALVVELDPRQPFTAARARNAGFDRLLADHPDLAYIQFVDGDCEVLPRWIETAAAHLDAHPTVAVVSGRRRERFPDASRYNRLCDLEWDTPVGAAKSCGGDALIRSAALTAIGGYDPAVIAGEEPELCVRLRKAKWVIERLDADMTLHDAAMTRFTQWWKRNVRAGHAYALGAAMHGKPPENHGVREVRSNYVWGFLLPLLAFAPLWPTRGLSLLLLPLGYGLLAWKIARSVRPRFGPYANLYARHVALGKIPQAWGQLRFILLRLLGRQSRVIEYKRPEATAA